MIYFYIIIFVNALYISEEFNEAIIDLYNTLCNKLIEAQLAGSEGIFKVALAISTGGYTD
jgi:hypothetical protein